MKKLIKRISDKLEILLAQQYINMTFSWLTDKKWVKTITIIIVFCSSVLGATLWILNTENPWGLVKEGQDWIGFWGSICGSIIGGIITLVALKKTIEFEREKTSQDIELNNRPYLVCKILNEDNEKTDYAYLSYLECDRHVDEKAPKPTDRIILRFAIKNIGENTSIDIKPIQIKSNGSISKKLYSVSELSKSVLFTPYIEKGKELSYNVDILNKDKFGKYDEIELEITFSDIFGCYYAQKIYFKLCDDSVDILDIKEPRKLGRIHKRIQKQYDIF